MRITPLFTTGVLAVAVGLTACSGGSQAIPGAGGAQAVAPATHSASHLVVVGAQRDASCPSGDFTCVTVNAASGGSVGICVSTTGTCGGTLSPYKWSGKFFTKKGKKFTHFKGVFSPNPGNPVTDTITERRALKSSKGNYNWYQTITACPQPSGSCLTGNIGIATS